MDHSEIKIIVDCPCGSFIGIEYKKRHLKSKKHLNYLKQNNLSDEMLNFTIFSLFECNENTNDLGFLHIKEEPIQE